MRTDTDKWLGGLGEIFLSEIGIRKGQEVLDFGCGRGDYVIPAAKIVGSQGQVYALDKGRRQLEQVASRAKLYRLENITLVLPSERLKVPLEDHSIDVVLLYDVIHPFYFSSATRRELLREIHRVSRPDALISVYPGHMDWRDAQREIESASLRLERRIYKTLLHNHRLIRDTVLNFRPQAPGVRNTDAN
jgi:ubiquinone/menaquinone biosynthesis C-methylase UbiE